MSVRARVKDLMTTRMIAARADASYADLAAMLREHRVSGFPVVDDDGVVVGVVSESDLLAGRGPGQRHSRPQHRRPGAARGGRDRRPRSFHLPGPRVPLSFSSPFRPGTLVPDLAAGMTLATGLRPRS